MDFSNEFKKKTANGKNKFAKKMAPKPLADQTNKNSTGSPSENKLN